MPESPTQLTDYIQTYDNALPGALCEQLVMGFEGATAHHTSHGRDVEEGLERSAWTELDIMPLADDAMKGFFIKQIETYLRAYNEKVPLSLPVPDYGTYQPLRIKRYRAGTAEAFQPHFDALGSVSHRYMVFLWYLNDVIDGGETEFCDLGVKVSARAGRLLMFPPYWMFQHAGLPPRSSNKYILSTYLLFPPNAGANARPLSSAATGPQ